MNEEQKHALARFIKTAPDRICLNIADHIDDIDRDAEFGKEMSLSDITWSAGAEGAVEVDVPYIRADLVPTWTPIDQIPDEWKDGRVLIMLSECRHCFTTSFSSWIIEHLQITHAMPLPTPPQDGGLER